MRRGEAEMLTSLTTLAQTCNTVFCMLSRGQGGVGRCRAAAILVPAPAPATQVVTWHRTTNRLWGNVGPENLHRMGIDTVRLSVFSCCQRLFGRLMARLLCHTVTLPFWPNFVRYSAVQDVDCAYSCHFRDWCALPRFHWS